MKIHIEYGCYSFPLALLYLIISIASLFQISRIIYFRHNVFHYQFGFLTYCFIWGLLRTAFWLFLPWDATNELWLQGSGLLVQFGTFSFLVLFYTQTVHRATKSWDSYRKVAITIYIIVNILFIASFAVTIVLALKFGANEDKIQSAHAFFIASMYFILAIFLAAYGSRLMCLVDQDLKVPFLKSKVTVSVLTGILVIVFVSRAVKDALSGLNIAELDFNDPVLQTVPVQTLFFVLYFVWEIIPAAMVLILFWRIPGNQNSAVLSSRSNFGSLTINSSSTQEFPISTTIRVSDGSNIFNNPSRYDSDPETSTGSKPGSISSAPIFRTSNKSILTGYNTRSPLLQPKGSPFDD